MAFGAAGIPPAVERLIEAGHWKQAQRLANEHLRADANDASAHLWLAKIRINFGDYEGAVAAAERCVKLEGQSPAAQAQLAEAYAMLADHASAIKGVGFVRQMNHALDAALTAEPKNLDALLVKMMFSWKAPLLAGGNRSRALSIANTIVGFSPAWGHLAYAKLLATKGDDANVEQHLKQAVQADPKLMRAQISLAEFYCCQSANKRLDLAERAARAALAIDNTAGPAYKILARVYATQHRWAELESTIAQAEANASEDLSPHYSAADALIATGQDFDRAERYLRKYLGVAVEARQASHAEAHRLLADLYRRQGRKNDAVRELQAALKLQPSYQQAKLELDALARS